VTKLSVVPLATLVFATIALAQEKAPMAGPPAEKAPPAEVKSAGPGKGTAQRTHTLTAKVQKVDLDNRLLILQTAKGDELDMTVGPNVKRLNEVSPGDTVKVKYEQGLMLEFRPEGATPAEGSGVSSTSTERKEAVLGGTKTTKVSASVKITKIDKKSRVVTLQGEKGKTFQLKAAPDIDIDKLKAGQTYAAVYTQTTAVSVEKP
jgi:Cu/Ag efflux protein CusF